VYRWWDGCSGAVRVGLLIVVRSVAATVDEYLAELPHGRRSDIEAMRAVILDNLPEGYDEVMRWGMITYEVPLDRHPDTYNGQPLALASLAAQKHYNALYLTGVAYTEGDDAFRNRYEQSGKKLDMGKSCLRYKSIDDLALDVIGETIAAMPVDDYVARYDRSRRG
jgi:Domain of unknown function (DU1801)